MADKLKLRVVRPLWFHGQARQVDDIISMTPAEAASALETGRAELVDGGDMHDVERARRAESAAAAGKARRLAPEPGGPWRPVS